MSSSTFAELGVSNIVATALAKRGIKSPFPVQELVIRDVLDGNDVLVQSPTGSGKTLAFGVPLVDLIAAVAPDDAARTVALSELLGALAANDPAIGTQLSELGHYDPVTADLTRDTVRTKAMALVGASIGLMFALSLVVSPVIAAHIGLSGLFVLTAVLALLGTQLTVLGEAERFGAVFANRCEVTSLVQDGGWAATDAAGAEVPVSLANGPFLAVRLAPGAHRITLRYSPPGFRLGSGISLATLGLLGLDSLRRRARGPRP